MSPIEHYFENLLTMGSDIKGEPNKNALSKEVQEAIEICADYTKHNQLYSNAIPNGNNADMIDMLTELHKEIEEKATEICDDGWWLTYNDIIQQKIEQLKENNNV
jgi:hypothetical protein